MARALLTSATAPSDEHGRLELGFVRDAAAQDRFGVHTLTDDPREADLIIFAEREKGAGKHLGQVRRHRYVKAFPEKCFVFNPRHKDVPLLPGVYAGVPRRWYDRHRMRAGHYPEVAEDEFFTYEPPGGELPHLYSFVGKTGTAHVRSRLAELEHPRGLFRDTVDEEIDLKETEESLTGEEEGYVQRYVDTARQSKFVLCPRGTGPSTLRLFESMLLGRAPVIVSDQWVPPEGPAWATFSLRVAEEDITDLPRILEDHEARAQEMGRRAREAWEDWFSPEVTFHRVVEWCLDIRRARRVPETLVHPLSHALLLRPSRLYLKGRHALFKSVGSLKRTLL